MIILHTTRVRIYYEDTDAGGIVYYANYLRFFERARTDWLRRLGVDQRRLAEDDGLGFVVRDCAIRYLRPARLDDEVDVHVGIDSATTDIRAASMRFAQRAVLANGDTMLASGNVRVACILIASGKPAPLPAWIMDRMSLSVAARTGGLDGDPPPRSTGATLSSRTPADP